MSQLIAAFAATKKIILPCCCLMLATISCKPVITSFTATTHDSTEVRKITLQDTVHFNYVVKGTPTLLFHPSQADEANVQNYDFTLVVKKAGKEANRTIQLQLLPSDDSTTIVFSTRLSGDTLIAEGDKNPGVWGDRFEIKTIKNPGERNLHVAHAGKLFLVNVGQSSTGFSGTPLQGRWQFRYLLSPAEKANHQLLPERLSVTAIITYKKR